MSSYIFRNHLARPFGAPSSRRQPTTPSGSRLTTISEGGVSGSNAADDDDETAAPAPQVLPQRRQAPYGTPQTSSYGSHPPRAHYKAFHKRFGSGGASLDADEKSPPSYRSIFGGAGSSIKSSTRASNSDYTPEPHFVERLRSRGGWKRLLLFILVAILLIIGLAVGLGVGLSQRNNSSSNSSTSSPSAASPSPQPFPIGSWSIPTYLTNTSTSCTSNSMTWNCPPYTQYQTSAPASFASFDWIINSTSSPPSNSSLTVASTANPFYITFDASKLTLVDADMPSERFEFSIPLPRHVTPQGVIGDGGATTTCFFNDTMLTGRLYTRTQATLHDSSSSTSAGGMQQEKEWPAAAYVAEVAGGGAGVPDCYPISGTTIIGPRITQGLTQQAASERCMCVYENAQGLN